MSHSPPTGPTETPDAFFRGLAELSLDVQTVLDMEGRVVYESPSVETQFGFPPQEFIGRSVLEYVHPDDHAEVTRRLQLLYAGAPGDPPDRIEVRFRHADGSWRFIEAVARFWALDGRPHVLVSSRDVTERRELIRALSYSNELYAKTVRASRNVLSVTERDSGRFVEVNDEWLRVSGFHRDEVIGRTADELGIWGSPDNRARFLRDFTASEGRLHDYPVTTYTRNGPRRLVLNVESLEVSARPLILMIGSDETERRQIEEQLRQAQRMEAIGQLTGGVAHDFNNLLAIVLGNADLMRRALAEQPALAAKADLIVQAAERGAAVTRQLLSFARRQLLAPRSVRLQEVVEALMPLLATTVGPSIDLRLRTTGDLPPALVDVSELENAILNLVVNARDALPSGGSIEIELERVDVAAGAAAAGDGELAAGRYLSLSVVDDGAGMDEQVAARAFEPFFTTKDVGRGTGLGLSMVFGFARQSGGQAGIESRPGAGTRATLMIPAATSAPQADGAAAGSTDRAPHGATGETVLLLEDEADLLTVMRLMLEHAGYRVRTARDEADLEALLDRGEHFDLLLSDVQLTGARRGPELARQVQARRPGVRVLFMSGHAGDALGPDAVLLGKPFTREALITTVRKVLDAPAD